MHGNYSPRYQSRRVWAGEAGKFPISNGMNVSRIDISWQTLWRTFIFIAGVFVFYEARSALGVFLVSVVISLGLDPIIGFLEDKKVHRLLGTILLFLFAILILSIAGYIIVPVVAHEAGGFVADFNKVVVSVFGFGLPQGVVKNIGFTLDKAFGFLNAANISITGALSSVFTRIVMLLAGVIITFYLTIEKEGTEKLFRVILPDTYEKPFLHVFSRFKLKIRRWFAAQLGLSLIMGVVVGVGLWMLNVKYFFVLALLAAIFEIVPVIGPILAGGIAFLIAISSSVSLGFYTLLFFFVVQQLENHILIPLIMGRAMKIHPVVVVISLIAGWEVAGFLGVLLSVPIAVISQETFNYLAERKSRKPDLGI